MDKTETKEMEGVEPILIQAGDKRVLLNGFPPILPIRVVAEAKYQEIISELQKAKELNGELVKFIKDNLWANEHDWNRINELIKKYSGLRRTATQRIQS